MPSKKIMEVGFQDFCYQNKRVRIVANRDCPEIKLAGLSIGPFEEGNEYEVYHWIAVELERSGIANRREEEQMNGTMLNKTQWAERVQTAKQISKLSQDFYPKLRRFLADLRVKTTGEPEKMRDYERIRDLTQDIVNSRLRKIVSIASAPAQTENTLRNLTPEERLLYGELYNLISQWRGQILEHEGAKQ